jgi:DNA-binding transcriptional regulator YdaS (Cro superfamily)
MDKESSKQALAEAVDKYPTLRAFSDAIGVPYQVVQQWRKNGVPAEHCPTIERLAGVLCERLNSGVDWPYVRSTGQSPQHPPPRRKPPAKTVMEAGVDQTDPNCVAQNPK